MRFRWWRCVIRSSFVLFAMAALTVFGQPQSGSPSGIEGVVTVGPIRPGPIRAGAETPNSIPFAQASFVVKNEKSSVTSFTTDDLGRFHVALLAGHYTVSLTVGRQNSFDVDVVDGKMTKVEWHCDTGMR